MILSSLALDLSKIAYDNQCYRKLSGQGRLVAN